MNVNGDNRKNRLAGEKSPYLLQHAGNPVDWYPWGEEAFTRAVRDSRPVFLSIGYSTCHWCHVMEKDSFENPDVAAILNEGFVSVKVDREERPDLDKLYMGVCQAITGSGGWPLTIIMTPQGLPFFAGTFFPANDAHGASGLKSILRAILKLWNENPEKIVTATVEISDYMNRGMASPMPGGLSSKLMDKAFEQLSGMYDDRHGGFGDTGPKFPQAHQLSFLLRHWKRTGERDALDMAADTLSHIIGGGIYDHLGGGVHRYSTDGAWFAPHFEKMLYDQALLSRALIEAGQAARDEKFSAAARDIFSYVLRDMTSPEGAFYSAEDADSEGSEGLFYLWTEKEIVEILGKPDGEEFCKKYGVTGKGNFEDGKNILYLNTKNMNASGAAGSAKDAERFADMKLKLLDVRSRRIRPRLDDKVLASWNGLMISSLSVGAQAFGARHYAAAAARAADFILKNMRRRDGRLLRRYRAGEAAVPGFLDDYAFFALGLLDLYEATFEPRRLLEAKEIIDGMLKLFRDPATGVFNYAAADAEKLPGRVGDDADGAEPSGNSIAALALLRFGRLVRNADYEKAGEEILERFAAKIARQPLAWTQMLAAVDFALGPCTEVLIVGGREHAETQRMIEFARGRYSPNTTILLYDPDEPGGAQLRELAPFLGEIKPSGGGPLAYVCSGRACGEPATDAIQLKARLRSA